jgi:hypothetical protein
MVGADHIKEYFNMFAIEKLVFYFTIECAVCHNLMKVSHMAVKDQSGALVCSLCGRQVKVPGHETLIEASDKLNQYLSDSQNSQYIRLIVNPEFKTVDLVPAAGH